MPITSAPTSQAQLLTAVHQASVVPGAQGEGPNGTMPTSFRSLGDLRESNPEMYNKMLNTMGSRMCTEWKHHEDRRKQRKSEQERAAR